MCVEITWLNVPNYDVTNGILQHKCSLNKITLNGINSELDFSLMEILILENIDWPLQLHTLTEKKGSSTAENLIKM